MSNLQKKVNLAFYKASLTKSLPASLESKTKREQWLKQEWPELQKPQVVHLSQLKTTRQLVPDEVKTLSIY